MIAKPAWVWWRDASCGLLLFVLLVCVFGIVEDSEDLKGVQMTYTCNTLSNFVIVNSTMLILFASLAKLLESR